MELVLPFSDFEIKKTKSGALWLKYWKRTRENTSNNLTLKESLYIIQGSHFTSEWLIQQRENAFRKKCICLIFINCPYHNHWLQTFSASNYQCYDLLASVSPLNTSYIILSSLSKPQFSQKQCYLNVFDTVYYL